MDCFSARSPVTDVIALLPIQFGKSEVEMNVLGYTMCENPMPIIVALLGAGGLGAFAREIADIVSKVKRGVSTKETNRKNDIIAQRDAAVADARASREREELERQRRIAFQEYAGTLRWRLRENGVAPDPLPDDIEDTLNPRKQD